MGEGGNDREENGNDRRMKEWQYILYEKSFKFLVVY
jgi:hypothetical protein